MYKLLKFTLDFCLFGFFLGMFIAEEFYDVKMIEQLKLLDQNLSSSPTLNTVNDCLSKNKPFFSPQSLFMIPVAFMVMMKQMKSLFAVLS